MMGKYIKQSARSLVVFRFSLLFLIVFLGIAQAEEPQKEGSPAQTEAITATSTDPQIKKGERPLRGERPLQDEAPAISFVLKGITVSGNTLIKSSELGLFLRPFLGTEIKLDGLQAIADGISGYYLQKGFSATAYLPVQTITKGSVVITILEGKIADIKVVGNKYYTERYIQGHLLRAKKSLLFSDWDRALLLLNDTQDLVVTSEFKAGASPGMTDVDVEAKDHLPLHAYLTYNNFGSRFVSRDRYSLRVSLGTPSGGMFSVKGLFSSPIGDLTYVILDYAHPINYNGTKLHAYYSYGNFLLGQDFRALDLKGKTKNYGLSVSHPFVRTRVRNLTGEIALDNRYSTQESVFSLEEVFEDALTLSTGLRYDRTLTWSHYYLTSFLTFGLGSGLGKGSLPPSNPDANAHFAKLNVTASDDIYVSKTVSLNVRGAGQLTEADQKLVASQQFPLGGFGTVRGFSQGEFLGDSGFNVTTELTYSPLQFRQLKLLSFMDYGQVFPGSNTVKNPYLSGYGVGAEYITPIYKGFFSLRLDVGWPLRFDDGITAPRPLEEPIYYVQATIGF